MSILIKGLEMPKNCFDCPLFDDVYTDADGDDDYICALGVSLDYYQVSGGNQKDCPLIYVPEHGRLIDADKIGLTDFEIILCQKGNPFKNALEMLLEKIENAPTVIQADDPKEE